MAASLERSDRERRDMLADVAHELRTPLSVIRGRLEGIVDGIYAENGSQVSLALEQTWMTCVCSLWLRPVNCHSIKSR
jgi:two-component system OmpR family sensor kinase/two-component system sensor histidine kinase BaeS